MEMAGAETAVSSVSVEENETAAPPSERGHDKVMFYSNCWLWAFSTCFRKGGFLIFSKSEWGWWPHVMWSPDMMSCYQFAPGAHVRLRGRLFPPFIFRGYVKTSRLRQLGDRVPILGPHPKRSPFRRLLLAGGVLAGAVALAGAGFGILMWSTFDGILPMQDRETFGSVVRLVDGYVSCFVVDDGNGNLFLIDTCSLKDAKVITGALSDMGRTPAEVHAILFTHGHADHTAGANQFDKAVVYAHRSERPLLEGEVAARGPLPRLSGRGPRIEVDELLEDGQHFTIGRRAIQVFHLPGHTDGSVAYLIDDTLLLLGDNGYAMTDGQMVSAPWVFSDDPDENRASLRALAERLKREHITPQHLVFSHSGALPPVALDEWAAEHPD